MISATFRPRRQARRPLVPGLSLLFFMLVSRAFAQTASADSIFFIQASDTHWGFNNPKVNPDYAGTLTKAISEINAVGGNPDFLIFTGDETHMTDDPAVRRQRMAQFKDIITALAVKTIRFIPGEHDAAGDNAMAYREFFGDPHYTFDVKGVHFVVLDNVSTPDGSLGADQLQWLAGVLKGFDTDSQVVVFAHRPLVPVWAAWGWRTPDGPLALDMLKRFRNVKLFYGHIHQQREDDSPGFDQYAAPGMMFPLPAPGSAASPNPLLWDAAHPYRELGFRTVRIDLTTRQFTIKEYGITPDGTLPVQ